MAVTIKFPKRVQTLSNTDNKVSPFFPVNEINLVREDGISTALKALVNGDTGETVGVVSKKYQTITHKQASDFIKDTLGNIGLPFEVGRVATASGGARFFEEIRFPSLGFNVASGQPSTALDTKGLTRDDLYPTILVKNSYDRTAPISWTYGAFRLVCMNGMIVGSVQDKLSFKHNSLELNFDTIRSRIHSNLEQTVKQIQDGYNKLNSDSGQTGLEALLNSKILSDKFKLMFLTRLGDNAQVDSSIGTDESGNSAVQTINQISTAQSAWSIYNLATATASHDLLSIVERQKHDQEVARIFQLA